MSRAKRTHVAGVSPLDKKGHKERPPFGGGIKLEESVNVRRPPMECYLLWRDLENLPRFMSHLYSVAAIDEKRSRWSATGPADTYIEWQAELMPVPPASLTPLGCLSPDYYAHDATHANEAYGALVLAQLRQHASSSPPIERSTDVHPSL